MFTLESTDNEARTGTLETAHGKVKTPFLMPCATKAVGKFIGSDDYNTINNQALIANAFILFLRPGLNVIQKAGGIHKFMNFNNTIFTDCGGFQVMRSFHQQTTKKALVMKDPWSLQVHRITPEKMMEIEQTIASDVAMALDDMPLADATKEQVTQSVKNTHNWQEQCKKFHNKDDQLLFGICQGGAYKDLRERSAKFINSLNFDGIAIGGVAIGETRDKVWKAVDYALPHITKDKSRYLMGVGRPEDILNAVERGIDCFDSVYPTQNARHGRLFTSNGRVDLNRGIYKEDLNPIDEECKCIVCKKYTRSYLRHLLTLQDPTYKRYASIHNITFMQKFMKQIREAIEEEEFQKFKKQILKVYDK